MVFPPSCRLFGCWQQNLFQGGGGLFKLLSRINCQNVSSKKHIALSRLSSHSPVYSNHSTCDALRENTAHLQNEFDSKKTCSINCSSSKPQPAKEDPSFLCHLNRNSCTKSSLALKQLPHRLSSQLGNFSQKIPSALYHQSIVNHASDKRGNSSNFQQTRLGSWQHPLLKGTGKDLEDKNRELTSFSPTKAILRASPSRIQPYLNLIRFDKPIGTWLLYWPCTWSIALAAQPGCWPDLRILALFGTGAFFMRGAGCIINDMWDKDFDAKVERTKMRPLASGEISSFQALVFLGCQLSLALAVLLQLNLYTVVLGASSMGLVVMYPLAKRYTYWPQLMLGLTLNWGVLMAWSELHGAVELPALTLYVACTLYTMIYDTLYSHQDKYDDQLIGVKSTALHFGSHTKQYLYGFTAIMTGGLATVGSLCDMTWPYYTAAGITTARLAQQVYSVNLDNAEECARAFRGNFYLGAVMFVGIVLANLLKVQAQDGEGEEKEGIN